ncbi:MAG: hypothetical protein H7Z75_00570, partial [Ferruginibacter sp.]|nr:hypothetical protein [Cytophagales bacterium]
MPFFDFTIVGAGASGLWLAFALYEQGLLEKNLLCVAESDSAKQNDRTWCYWADSPLLPINMVSKAWSSIRNPYNPSSRDDLSPYTYYHVRSADFYANIKQQLKGCANITWLTAVVIGLEEQDDQVLVQTTHGAWLSNQVFTSALPPQDER